MKKWVREKEWLIRDKYAGNRAADLANDLARLRAGEPIDYIIGWKDFLGMKIDLSLRPLIPRPETEYWVERAIEEIKSRGKVRVLDLFSGSGCVGLAVKEHCPLTQVTSADIENRAVGIKLIKSNIFSGVKSRYDFILANPPYIPSGRRLNKSVSGFEPKRALFSGKDGLTIIRKFLRELSDHLRSGGVCYLEFDTGQKRKIDDFLKKLGYLNYTFHRDQFGRFRFVVISR